MRAFNQNLFKSELILHNLSLADLAKMLKKTKASVSKKVNGKSDWKLYELQIIAKAVETDKLMSIFLVKKFLIRNKIRKEYEDREQ